MENNDEDKELSKMRSLTRWYVEKGYEFDYVPIEERDAEQARALLLKAEDNLTSAKREYKHKSYSNCITNTQQAVEKLGKSILIATGLAKSKDLKNISHRFSTYLIHKLKSFFISLIGYSDDEFNSAIINKTEQFFETYKEKRKTHSLVQNIDELKHYLKSYESIFSLIMNQIETMNKIEVQFPALETYRDSFEAVLDELELISDTQFSSEEKDKLLLQYYQFFQEQNPLLQITNTVSVSIILFFISILSMNLDIHYERSRYPKKKDDFYTKDDDIVKVLPVMMKTISVIIHNYYYILSFNNLEEE